MRQAKESRRPLALTASRWSAYASASAATTLTAIPAVEATVHYSGPVNAVFNRDFVLQTFPLSGGASLVFRFPGSVSEYYDAADFKVTGAAASAYIRGVQRPPLSFVSRLKSGANISKGHFFPAGISLRLFRHLFARNLFARRMETSRPRLCRFRI